jgi:competence protein ComEA
MERRFRQALWRIAMRVIGWRFSKPIARVAGAAAGLWLLAFFGRNAVPGALGAPQAAAAPPAVASGSPERPVPSAATSTSSVGPAPVPSPPSPPSPASGRASSDDPVVLNTATEADLRRLPGIGVKRAVAILALRARVGRFRAVEDLLKVKGVGRATLKRLRPLLRLDPMAADAGAPRATKANEPRDPATP